MKMLKEVLQKNLEYHSFYQQIQLQVERERSLREEVKEKLADLNKVENKLESIFRDMEVNYAHRIEIFMNRLDKVETTNKNLREKILEIEDKSQKEQIARQMKNLGMADDPIKKSRDNDAVNQVNPFNLQIKTSFFEPKCINRGSCRLCLEDPECVFCESSNSCKEGDSSGAFDGSCDKFKFTSCDSEECLRIENCEECISNAKCGWCGDSNKCSEGGKFSMIGGICSGNYIHLFKQGRCRSHLK
jgi:hypothetical protein